MGKAHTCVLTKSGEVWTFGVNNKGQCGRDTGAMNQAGKGEGSDGHTDTQTHRQLLHYYSNIVSFSLSLSLFSLLSSPLSSLLSPLSSPGSVWRGEHGDGHGRGLGGRPGGEGGEEHDVPARHAQVEAGAVHGVHGVRRLHRLRGQLCEQRAARQSAWRVGNLSGVVRTLL